jgi:hypothetical protein
MIEQRDSGGLDGAVVDPADPVLEIDESLLDVVRSGPEDAGAGLLVLEADDGLAEGWIVSSSSSRVPRTSE